MPDITNQLCQWVARCTNPATVEMSHVILGMVPTCRRCADRWWRMYEELYLEIDDS